MLSLFKRKSGILYKNILQMWWNEHKLSLKSSTAFHQEEFLHSNIIPWFGDVPVCKITLHGIQEYVDYKLEHGSPLRHPEGLSVDTIRKHLGIIRMSLEWAVTNGYIKESPYSSKGILLPSRERKEISIFSPTEIDLLIESAEPKWFKDVINLAYLTGMRRGEIFGLKWSDIDFENKLLTVRRSVVAVSPKEMYIGSPKTKRSTRCILLDGEAIATLKSRQKEIISSDWVFPGKSVDPMSPWYVPQKMKYACKKAGIPHRRFHDLRHSHATFLLSKNINPKIVQERLGHSKISTTLDTYSHAVPSMQSIIVNILNNMHDD